MNFETSEQIDQIAAALAAAQGEMTSPDRNRTVRVRSKRTGTEYTFAYATLDNIMSLVRPALAKNGLAISQATVQVEGKLRLLTQLAHASGQWFRSSIPIILKTDDGEEPTMQVLGSGVTYARRYGISAMLNIASEEDDDGNAASANEIKEDNYRPRPSAPVAPAPKPVEAPRETVDAPAPDKAQEARDAYKRLKKAIEAATTERTIDDIWKLQSAALEVIKEVSPNGHATLTQMADAKRQEIKDKEG